jgi:outer membrane protein assembly factor BamB
MTCLKRVLILLLPAAMTAAGFTFRGDNGRTGRVAAGIHAPLLRAATLATGGAVISSPVMAGDTCFIGSRDSCVYALVKGKRLWRFKTAGWVDASPALSDGRLYAGSRDGRLYILDKGDGDSLGVIENNNAQCSSPLIAGGQVIFGRGGWNRQIDAYDVLTKEYTWFKVNPQPVYSSPAANDSLVCYGDNAGNLVAVNLLTGTQRWSYATRGGTYLSSPAIDGDLVWFSPGAYDNYVYALTVKDGQLIWKNTSALEQASQPVAKSLVQGLLKYRPAARQAVIESYSRSNRLSKGQVQSLAALAQPSPSPTFVPFGGVATSSVAVGDSLVYVVHKEFGYPKPRFTLTAYEKTTGVQRWCYSELRTCEQLGFCASPLVSDSLVLAGWGEGKFYAFDALKGSVVWQDSLDGDILSSPAASKGIVTVATVKGTVYTYVTNGFLEPAFQNQTYSYPNPARGSVAHLQVFVDQPADLTLNLYNFANQPVMSLQRSVGAGAFRHDWSLAKVANGVYFCHVRAKYRDGSEDRKIIKIAVLR